MANSYSRGDREFEKATATLFPSKFAQRGRRPRNLLMNGLCAIFQSRWIPAYS